MNLKYIIKILCYHSFGVVLLQKEKTMETTPQSARIIQGGMGMFVSGPRMARAVSMEGQLGTLSGVCLDKALVRKLQSGDLDGNLRRALSHFPFPTFAENVLKEYFVEGGIPKGKAFKNAPVFTVNPPPLLISLTVCANFAFVWLAKEGHQNPVSINYLEKVAMPHVFAITGAILAGVDYITMGAGIPLQIPGVIESIVQGKTANYRMAVLGTNVNSYTMSFNPEEFFGQKLPALKKPRFIPIISSYLLARLFIDKLPQSQQVSGFVIEETTAGGHNAPPRRPPNYGPKDAVDYEKMAKLGVPFWIGGSKASPESLAWALSVGAQGIQVGSCFALCEESEIDRALKREIRERGYLGTLKVRTDMQISPTGFPFKVAEVGKTISDPNVLGKRVRICDQRALVSLYERPGGSIGYRCPSEALEIWSKKGGKYEDTLGKGCICNALLRTVGLNDESEPALVTLGDDSSFLQKLMTNAQSTFTVADVIKFLLS